MDLNSSLTDIKRNGQVNLSRFEDIKLPKGLPSYIRLVLLYSLISKPNSKIKT